MGDPPPKVSAHRHGDVSNDASLWQSGRLEGVFTRLDRHGAETHGSRGR
jgi:hypothetical protein